MLQVDPSARNVVIMRVLRAELGLDLAGVRSVLNEVVDSAFSGTMPELEFLPRKLRASRVNSGAVK